jgi:sulfite exporter TauE/SafE
MYLWSAFLLGLAGSLHCAGMCGPLLLALGKTLPSTPNPGVGRVCYHIGRVTVYSLLGAVFGTMGHVAVPDGFQRWLSVALGVALLAGFVIPRKTTLAAPMFQWIGWMKNAMAGLLGRNSIGAQAVMGALNGLLPCGLVYVAAVGATATGHPLSGAAYMTLFGLGTWPLLLSIHFAGRRVALPSRLSLTGITRGAVFLMAVLLILRGMELGIPFISPGLPMANGSVSCH